jgi:hypothetical protein
MPEMLKGYVSRWKKREKPEDHITDYWFNEQIANAACWPTRLDAENWCTILNAHCNECHDSVIRGRGLPLP